MEDKNIHSKIIKQVCKEVLFPIGVFQKGTSRLYIDDNDYFFTLIEFQPSGYDRGTYLNIGLTFLWEYPQTDILSFGFPRRIAGRYAEFAAYENEAQFRGEVIKLANLAKEEILFYRKLRDTAFAEDWMIAYAEKFTGNQYARFGLPVANICTLNDDRETAKFYYENYHRERNTQAKMNEEELSKEYLFSNIQANRKMWHSKPAMKKMPISAIYDSSLSKEIG